MSIMFNNMLSYNTQIITGWSAEVSQRSFAPPTFRKSHFNSSWRETGEYRRDERLKEKDQKKGVSQPDRFDLFDIDGNILKLVARWSEKTKTLGVNGHDS